MQPTIRLKTFTLALCTLLTAAPTLAQNGDPREQIVELAQVIQSSVQQSNAPVSNLRQAQSLLVQALRLISLQGGGQGSGDQLPPGRFEFSCSGSDTSIYLAAKFVPAVGQAGEFHKTLATTSQTECARAKQLLEHNCAYGPACAARVCIAADALYPSYEANLVELKIVGTSDRFTPATVASYPNKNLCAANEQ